MPAKRAAAAAAAAQHAVPPSPSSSESEHDVGHAPGTERFFDPHYSQKFLASLPAPIRTRARVLLHYHDEYMALQKEAEQAELELRRKYEALYAPLLQRRCEIVAGAAVSDEEVRRGYPAEHEGKVSLTANSIDGDDDDAKEAKKDGEQHKKSAVEDEEGAAAATTTATAATATAKEEEKDSGLPGFWLRVLQHHIAFEHRIYPHDEPVLHSLTNISSHITDGEYGSFAVVFSFAPNDYLVSEQLRLEVRLVEGTTTVVRTPPVWRPGKNVTVRSVAQKQRSRRTGRTRTITREETQPSFFALFTEPSSDDDDDDDDDAEVAAGKKKGGRGGAAAVRRRNNNHDDDDEDDDDKDGDDTEQMVQMLQLLHMHIIPAAVDYYTGEAPDGSSDADDDDEEYDEDDDEEDDDSDE